MKEKSLALELLADYKAQNKRLFVIICILLVIIALFVGGLVYVVTNYDFTYESAETDTGNACIGENCGNGDVNNG